MADGSNVGFCGETRGCLWETRIGRSGFQAPGGVLMCGHIQNFLGDFDPGEFNLFGDFGASEVD